MMLVKTTIGPSEIHGIGIFASEFISKGTIIWKFFPGFDLRFSDEDLEKMPQVAQEFMATYEYLSERSGLHVLCSDNARFYNHSDHPNTMGIDIDGTEGEGGDIAIRDIYPGEEITCNYLEMDLNSRNKLKNILNGTKVF